MAIEASADLLGLAAFAEGAWQGVAEDESLPASKHIPVVARGWLAP